MKQKFETSESIRIGVVLAISGGFMDAYSYTGRGGVFANAETGNIVLLAISIGNKNLQGIFHYLVPIMSFAVGVMISQHVKIRRKNRPTKLHWRQVTIFFETVDVYSGFFTAAVQPVGKLSYLAYVRNSGSHVCQDTRLCDVDDDVHRQPQDRNYESEYVFGNKGIPIYQEIPSLLRKYRVFYSRRDYR